MGLAIFILLLWMMYALWTNNSTGDVSPCITLQRRAEERRVREHYCFGVDGSWFQK